MGIEDAVRARAHYDTYLTIHHTHDTTEARRDANPSKTE
jgi:hypothetical protein